MARKLFQQVLDNCTNDDRRQYGCNVGLDFGS